MTKALKIRIGNLLFELLAHTLVFLCTLNSARAVTACPLQALFNCFYYFFVGIKCYFHLLTPQFLRHPPSISSLAYTIYSNLNLVKLRVPRTQFVARSSHHIYIHSYRNANHIMPECSIVTICTNKRKKSEHQKTMLG